MVNNDLSGKNGPLVLIFSCVGFLITSQERSLHTILVTGLSSNWVEAGKDMPYFVEMRKLIFNCIVCIY